MSAIERWRGLRALVEDAVDHGSRAVERVQKETAKRPFWVLERIPVVATPARVVHELFDLSVSTTHGTIRLVNRAVGAAIEAGLDLASHAAPDPPRDPGGSEGAKLVSSKAR